jgi:hypothetical protein
MFTHHIKYLLALWLLGLSFCHAQSTFKQSDTESETESFLQTFMDLNPIGKQTHIYENVLKIKPNHIMSWSYPTQQSTPSIMRRAKSLFYSVKGCDFHVDVDADNNVVEYKVKLDKFCPFFEITTPIRFDSKKSTLKNIVTEMINNSKERPFTQGHRFTSVELSWQECGRMCVPDANYLTQNVGLARFSHINITFEFNSNDGIEKWKSEVLNFYGGVKGYLDNCKKNERSGRCDSNPSGKYNRLAEQFWENKRPDGIIISYYDPQ